MSAVPKKRTDKIRRQLGGIYMEDLREWMQEHNGIIVIVLIAVIIIGLAIYIRHDDTPTLPPAIDVYYFDLTTEESFAGTTDQVPPFIRDNGNEAVRVVYFTCGDCDEEETRERAWYEKYTDEAKAKIETLLEEKNPEARGDFSEDLLISFDGEEWFPSRSRDASDIYSHLNQQCGDNEVKYCDPPKDK